MPLAQPAGRLARNLLDPDIKMDEPFLKEQDRRRKARLNDQIYDVTAWSLPLMFDVDIVASERASTVRTRDVRPDEELPAQAVTTANAIGFVMPWSSGAAAASIEALRQGIRITTVDEPFTHGGRKYPLGTAFVRFAGNAEGTAANFQKIAQRHGAEIVPVTETWTEEGVLARQRPRGSPRVDARAAGVGRTRIFALRRMGALRARAALRPAGHGDADVDAAELRYEGLRRPRPAFGQLHLQR